MAGVLLGALAAIVAAILTPPSGATPESGLQGLPRLLAYVSGGVALALTVPRCSRLEPAIDRVTDRRAFLVLALGGVLTLLGLAFEITRLTRDMADPLGPALWIGSMLVLLGITVVPAVRRIGWPAVWPATNLGQRYGLVVLGVLVLAAAVMRVPGLDHLPAGINADEGDRAATAFAVLDGTAPRSWFDSGWFYINMVYFRLLALSFMFFGSDVGGGRMLNALAGIAFVAVVGWFGSRHFGWRVGVLATAFAAGAGVSLQHGRMISETGPTAVLWATTLGGFLEGARRGRLWAFALAGVSGGASLYFYPSARLWAVGAVLSIVALVIPFARRADLRRELALGIGIAGLASVVAATPFLVHLNVNRFEIAHRFAQTSAFDPANQGRLTYLRPPEAWPRLAALQIERSLGMFDRHPDGGGLLPTGRPIFPPPIAALVLLSIVYATVRGVRDLRLALLAIWFWIGVSGVILTVETPNVLRAVGSLPALFVMLAVLLLDVVDRVLDVAQRARPSGARRVYGAVLPVLLGMLIAGSEATTYFNTFRTLPGPWGPSTREGLQVAALGVNGPVYSLEMSEHLVASGWVRLLAPETQRGRLPNPGRDLLHLTPAPAAGQGLSLLFSRDPHQRTYFGLAQALYPAGRFVDAADGRQAYSVPPAALDATRGTIVHQPGAPPRPSPTFGGVLDGAAPTGSSTWTGGVWLTDGEHQVEVIGPAGSGLRIDALDLGRGGPIATARGLHYVELSGEQGVRLIVDGREVDGHTIYRLMDAPWGLLGRIGSVPGRAFVDATVAMAFADSALGPLQPPTTITWSGQLLAPRSGVYRMLFAAEDAMRLEIDGQDANVATVGPDGWERVGLGSAVQLTEGPHDVRVTLDVTHGGRELARWNWVTPRADGTIDTNGEWSVVPPAVLRPEAPVRRL